MVAKLKVYRRMQAEDNINKRISLDEETSMVTASCKYLEAKLENLGNNKHGALQRAIKNYGKIQLKDNVAEAVDNYVMSQLTEGKWLEVSEEELDNEYRKHFIVNSFVEAPSSSSTKVRVVTDTSARTETGVCLNDVI